MRLSIKLMMGGAALWMVAFGCSTAGAQDVKYTTEMSTEGGAAAQMPRGMSMPKISYTVYVKGQQERRDMNMMGNTISYITDCATNKTVIVNLKCNAFMSTSPDAEPGMAMGRPGAPSRGGVVKVESEYHDTGEHKQMLGRDARHVTMRMKMTPSADACMPAGHEQEMDLWLVNVDAVPRCRAAQNYKPQQIQGCQDKFEVSTRGQAAMRGLPVVTRMSMDTPQGKTTMTMTVTDLEVGPVDASQFQVPSGLREVKSMQELYMCGMGAPGGAPPRGGAGPRQGTRPSDDEITAAMNRAREARRQAEAEGEEATRGRSGKIRIGVYMTGTAANMPGEALSQQVAEQISEIDGFEGVALRSPNEVEVKKCTFLLTSEVSETRPSGGGRVGGILGRAAGVNTQAGKRQVKMEYRLQHVASGDEVNHDTLNNAFTDEEGPSAMFQSTAARATRDARRYKRN